MKMGVGPVPAKVMLVGEAFGEQEERAGEPFVGTSGQELNRMLHEAGIMRTECYTTNLVNARPPHNDITAWIALKKKDVTIEHVPFRDKHVRPIIQLGYESLLKEIELVKPNVIVPFGNSSMWALTGAWGIVKWRGSMLRANDLPGRPKVIPTYHPTAVLRQWDWRAVAVSDLRRVAKEMHSTDYLAEPNWKFIIRPGFRQVIDTLAELQSRLDSGEELWLDFDLETRAGHIACAGISWSREEAICIPFMCVESREGYWQEAEEAAIVYRLYKLLTHLRVKIRWQNGLYDAQYTYRHWGFVPRGVQDTMISQHALFAALPKSLAFQASMYSPHYVYWKDDGKTWAKEVGEDQLWSYNCVDCIRTREVGEAELEAVKSMGMEDVHEFQQRLFWPVLRAMQLGVRVLKPARDALANEIQDELAEREDYLRRVIGHGINPGSHPQMTALFYHDLQQKPIMTRAKKGVPGHLTCDDEALQLIATREPLLRPIINAIADIRTLGIFMSNFVLARVDQDGRMRCSYNIGGNAGGKSAPYSYRLSSSKSAFDSGTNLQNIPSDKSKSVGKAAKRGGTFKMPNIRSMFGPDPGMTFFDMDLDRADLQVVVWEADDKDLKTALQMGVDIHLLNVYAIDGQEPPPYEELVETHPRYPDHRGPRKHKREFAKVFCHASNYGGGARTVAANTGRTIHEIDRAQRIWFGAHPGIKQWHERTLAQVNRHRFVENKFGYRWYIFDRLDGILPEALAWIPQSTVGCVINRAWVNLYEQLPEVQVLLQVHDSLAGQFPTSNKARLLPLIEQASLITIPYEEPLIIPVGIKTSEVSWGDCE